MAGRARWRQCWDDQATDAIWGPLISPRAFVGGRACALSNTYDYAIIRVVPRVERGEFINVGVILSCPHREFLEARVELDISSSSCWILYWMSKRIRPISNIIPLCCRGGAAAGAIGELRSAAAFTGWCRRAARLFSRRPFNTGRTHDSGRRVGASARHDGETGHVEPHSGR